MNKQVSNMLNNLITQHKNDFKAFIDQAELHLVKEDPDFTKLNDCMNAITENQTMIRSLLCRLWAA